MTLLALEKALSRDLEILDYPKKDWIRAQKNSLGENIFDVLIVGGGQSGLAASFGLIREKVKNIIVLDENAFGKAGPWNNFARMITLRTPKYVIGPELGIPNLSIRSWYEATYGDEAWQKLSLIPKEDWAKYLCWYEKVLNLPVEHEAKATSISWQPNENCFQVGFIKNGQESFYWAKKIVLANGIEGSGEWHTPGFIKENLQKELYAHTNEHIDFQKLKGKKVAVFGAGASAFDAASVALEQGAASVNLFFRRKTLPRVNPYRWAEFTGFLNHHANLSDEEKYNFIHQIIAMGQLPPKDTFARAKKYNNFFLEPEQDIKEVVQLGDKVRLKTNKAEHEVDFLIIGTGFKTDLKLRPELLNFESKIARWKDRVDPKDKLYDLMEHPYLGENFEFLEKEPQGKSYINSIFCYNFGCLLSLGFGGASISGMKYSINKLIFGITKQLYLDDRAHHLASLKDFAIEEF